MNRTLLGLTTVALATSAYAFAACDAGGGGSSTDDDGAGASGNAGGAGGAGGIDFTGSGGGDTVGVGCTADLQAIVDENGAVLMQCPPEQG